MKEGGSLIDKGAVFVNDTTGSQFEFNSNTEYDQVAEKSPSKSEEWGDWDGVSRVDLDANDSDTIGTDQNKNTIGVIFKNDENLKDCEKESGVGWSNDF